MSASPYSFAEDASQFSDKQGAVKVLAFLAVLLTEVAYGIALTLGFFNISKFLIGQKRYEQFALTLFYISGQFCLLCHTVAAILQFFYPMSLDPGLSSSCSAFLYKFTLMTSSIYFNQVLALAQLLILYELNSVLEMSLAQMNKQT